MGHAGDKPPEHPAPRNVPWLVRSAIVLGSILGAIGVLGAIGAIGPAPAAAQQARLVARGPDGVWTTGPVQARIGDEIEVRAAVQEDDGSILCDVAPLRWDGRRARPRGPLAASVRFVRVIPRMQHVEGASPNPGIPSFSNAVLTGPSHGAWIGFDRLEYVEQALEVGSAGAGIAIEGPRASVRGTGEHGGAGSIWLAAEVTWGGRTLRTPDASRVDRFGLRPEVLRVSFREGDDFVGWLATYFGVPNVFGSSGPGRDHQAERYVGADCADVLVGARRAMGAAMPYVSVAGIGSVARPVSEVVRQRGDGTLDRALAWGRDVERGDLVAIDYVEEDDGDPELPRAWDHIGALVGDDGDGVLDGGDRLRHMTHQGLEDRPLGREGEIRIRLWRFR